MPEKQQINKKTHSDDLCVLSCIWLYATQRTDCSPPDPYAHWIFQAGKLEGVAIFPPEDLSDSGFEPLSAVSPALAGSFFITVSPAKPK